MKEFMSGDEAVARGAYEAGVMFASAYPGTPSTEVLENLSRYKDCVYAEWAPNEKVAAEASYGASIAGGRSLCAMKHVGLNVAADPVFTAAYNGVGGGFVIITADDPDMHSSQNEQDNRHYARAAKIPMIEPSDSMECLDFIKEAFEISEKFDIPVLYRMTTRVCHSKGIVETGTRTECDVKPYRKNVKKNVASPANARVNHVKLEKAMAALREYSDRSPLNHVEMAGEETGVIAAGAAYQYAKEAFPKDTSFLKLGMTYPLPMGVIADFASKVKTLYVIEELDPFMEEQIRAEGIDCIGKKIIPAIYELNPQIVREAVFGEAASCLEVGSQAVVRPPALCPGCPHRGFFYTVGADVDNVVAGDIGCYTLGSSPPLSGIDTVVCMGGGFSVAQGFAKIFEMTGQKEKTVFGVMGDSTFFHSGMTGAAEILYNNGNVIPCILDNRITGMTGQQENPGSGYNLMGEPTKEISIESVLRSMGYETVITADPQDLKAMRKAVNDAKAAREAGVPSAIVTKRPCLLIKRERKPASPMNVVQKLCKACRKCLGVGCPAISFDNEGAHIDASLCTGCTVCAQVCPFRAIAGGNHNE